METIFKGGFDKEAPLKVIEFAVDDIRSIDIAYDVIRQKKFLQVVFNSDAIK